MEASYHFVLRNFVFLFCEILKTFFFLPAKVLLSDNAILVYNLTVFESHGFMFRYHSITFGKFDLE